MNLPRIVVVVTALLVSFGGRLGASGPQSPFDDHAGGLQLAGVLMSESWDKNESPETLGGGSMTLARPFRRAWMGMLEASFLRVADDRRPDPFLSGFTILLRRRVHETRRASTFVEAGPGISYASRPTPAGGTRMNYLFQAGLGTLIRMAPAGYLVAGARYLHLSNNSLAGRDRNPDIQAVGGYLGTLLLF